MRLPNSEKAVVEIEKLLDYSLNPNHPVGKHKARVFQTALGITIEHADWLRDRALDAALSDAKPGTKSVFGDKYIVDFPIEFEGKSAVVRLTWIVEFGTDFTSLTSC